MARPNTKEDLISSSNIGYDKIMKLIDSINRDELTVPFGFVNDENLKEAHWHRDKNIRDVLVHLYEWHQLLLKWIEANTSGETQPFLPSPYNWKTYGEMNVAFWQKHQSTSLEDAFLLLAQSHADVMRLIDTFDNEQLFTNKYFKWTGTTSLGSYCVSATSSHYDWAIKKIKKHKNNLSIK